MTAIRHVRAFTRQIPRLPKGGHRRAEAIRFAQGLPIEEVIVVENRQLELNFPTEEAKEPTDE